VYHYTHITEKTTSVTNHPSPQAETHSNPLYACLPLNIAPEGQDKEKSLPLANPATEHPAKSDNEETRSGSRCSQRNRQVN
jgi:hypothetical protein